MKRRNAIFFSIAVIFYSWLALGVFVKAAPVDDDAAPEYDPPAYPDAPPDLAPEPLPDAGPEPLPDAGPEPLPDAGPEPLPDAGPEPLPDAGPEPLPDAGPEPVVDAGPEPEPDTGVDSPPEPDQPGPDAGPDEDIEESESESESDSESESESDSDESDERKSGSDAYSWLEEWQKRIVDLNFVVYRLQGQNAKLKREVYEYEKELQSVQALETSLSNEVETWLNGMQFPGLAPVHDPLGIKSDHIINSVGEEVDDCNDALGKGHEKPGVYLLNPDGSPYNVRALCVNGWTVVQRRFDGLEDFNRDFDGYVSGFGNFSGEFFLGLENLHRMALNKGYTLRVDTKGASGKWYYGVYDDFGLTDETDQYRLLLGNMSAGNYFDGFDNSRDEQFSTRDRDNDKWRGGNCAEHYGGGWWSSTCNTNLNQMWCRNGCLRWASKRVVTSIIRIKPTSAVVPEDLTEDPNPAGLTLDETPA